MKLIQSKQFYKTAFMIMLPILLQQLVSSSVVFIDNFMVGQISINALAGVYAANQAYFIITTALFGLTAATGIFLAQFRGAKNAQGVSYSFRWSLKWSLLVSSTLSLLFFVFQDQFLGLFTESEETLNYAKEYFKLIFIAYTISAITISYGNALRTIGKSKWTLYNEMVGLVLNVFLNWIFIFGNLGAPELGVEGAAISTIIARVIQILIYIYMGNIADKDLHIIKVFSVKRIAGLTKDIFVKAIPMVTNEVLWSLSLVVAVSIIAMRGEVAFDAYAVRQSVAQFSYIIFGSMAGTVAVMVGQKLGANKFDEALDNFKGLIVMGSALAWVVVLLNWVLAPLAVDLFNVTDPDVRKLSIDFLRYGALLFPIFILNATSFFVIRSGGKIVRVFLFDSVWNWVVFIPALYFCMVSDLPIMWAFMIGWGTDIIKLLFVLPYALRGKWARNLVNKYGETVV